MKIIWIVPILMLLFVGPAFGSDLEIVMAKFMKIGEEQKRVYVFRKKGHETKISHRYKGYLLLKNTGSTDLTVVTKSFSPGIEYGMGNAPAKVSVKIYPKNYNGRPIIPSPTELSLVTLRSNEIAQVGFEKGSFVTLKSVILEYNIQDIYDGRFGHWVGRVVSDVIKVDNRYNKSKQTGATGR